VAFDDTDAARALGRAEARHREGRNRNDCRKGEDSDLLGIHFQYTS
jgi:hypothetical protein